MPTGVVRSFNEEEGYGFIQTQDGDKVFVHHSNIEMEGFRTLAPGTQVAYEVEVGKRGPEAVRVRKV
jgi:CspA family cold shock protein